MSNDGLISSNIPRIYYREGDLEPFLRAIDEELSSIEKWIDNIPNLADVDTCEEYALPYLAATIHCPLWGQSPAMWRKQIKNWPYICRMKGTKRGLRYFFDAFGFIAEKIETYWRDNHGEYVIDKPAGAPYLDTSTGLWNNSKTHYFGLELSYDDNFADVNYHPDLINATANIMEWIEWVKPFHAELLKVFIKKYLKEQTQTIYTGIADMLSGTATILPRAPDMDSQMAMRFGIAKQLSGNAAIRTPTIASSTAQLSIGGIIAHGGGRTIRANVDDLPKFEEFTAQLILRSGIAQTRGGTRTIYPSVLLDARLQTRIGGAVALQTGRQSILPAEPQAARWSICTGCAIVKSGNIIIKEAH